MKIFSETIAGCPLHPKCFILSKHEKYDIFAINKAPGVQTHPNTQNTSRTPSLLKADYCEEEEKYTWKDSLSCLRSLYLVHRLDSPTSGLLLATTCKTWATYLRNCFSARIIEKTYHAVVKAQTRGAFGIWKDTLLKVNSKGKLRVKKHKNGKLAETLVEKVRSTNSTNQPLALLKLTPKTGRTHQLRVQCANRGMSIIGDRTYGDFSLNRKISVKNNIDRMLLHASELSFDLHDSQMPSISWSIESPIPRDFIRLFS